jgi:uncharacterized protein
MEPNVAVVRRFYEAMRTLDTTALLDTLAEDFTGHVSPGFPRGLGRTYHGRERMLRDCWIPVYQTFAALPQPHQMLDAPPDHVAVTGDYEGAPPASGRRFSAAFAHVFRIADGRIAELRQITDTARWAEALAE